MTNLLGSPIKIVVSVYNIEPRCLRLKKINLIICPRCWSGKIIKNGSIHNGKQKYMCRECGRQFVENPANRPVSGEKKELINRLYC